MGEKKLRQKELQVEKALKWKQIVIYAVSRKMLVWLECGAMSGWKSMVIQARLANLELHFLEFLSFYCFRWGYEAIFLGDWAEVKQKPCLHQECQCVSRCYWLSHMLFLLLCYVICFYETVTVLLAPSIRARIFPNSVFLNPALCFC